MLKIFNGIGGVKRLIRISLLNKTLIIGFVLTIMMTTTIVPSCSTPEKNIMPELLIEENYNKDVRVPDCVKEGDLLLIDWVFDVGEDESNIWFRSGPYNDHGALYIGNNTFVDSRKKGIVANNYYRFCRFKKNLVFLRVKTANESQRHAAVEWAKSMIGFTYQDFFEFPWFGLKIAHTDLLFPTADKIYCMELLWAAYYLQGIDIDKNGWHFPPWVIAEDILYDDDVEIIYQELDNSTGIIKPNKGIYLGNKKILFTLSKTLLFGGIDIEVMTLNEKITHVDFFIDTIYKATDTEPPYIWSWNEHDSGKKMIKAVAYDDEGNQYPTRITVWRLF